ALAEDVAPARHVDDGAHAEEVRRHLELLDQRELLLELLRDLLRDRLPVAAPRARVRQAAERLLGRLAIARLLSRSRHFGPAEVAVHEVGDLVREAIRELLHREATALGDEARARHPLGVQREEAGHLLLALEMGLCVGAELAAGL